MGEIILKGYLCERCNHKWPPRNFSNQKPFVCPKCKSPYWNTPKKNSSDKKTKSYGLFPPSSKKEVETFGLFPNNKKKNG